MASQKPGDAVADHDRDQFDQRRRERRETLLRLKVRADMRDAGEPEDTQRINAVVAKSDPPPSTWHGTALATLKLIPPAWRVLALGMILATGVAIYVLRMVYGAK